MLQPDKLDLIIAMIKEVESHELRIHWTLMKNGEVKNKHKINMESSKIFYPFGISIA